MSATRSLEKLRMYRNQGMNYILQGVFDSPPKTDKVNSIHHNIKQTDTYMELFHERYGNPVNLIRFITSHAMHLYLGAIHRAYDESTKEFSQNKTTNESFPEEYDLE